MQCKSNQTFSSNVYNKHLIISKDGHGQELIAAGGAHICLALQLRRLHRVLPSYIVVRWLPPMPLGEHPQPARLHTELAFVHAAAQVLHQEPQVLHAQHRAAALHRHADERLPRSGRRALRPPERDAHPRAQRRPRLRGPVVPVRAPRGVRGARPVKPPRRARRPADLHRVGRLRRDARRALLRRREGQQPSRVPGRPVPDRRRRGTFQRRRLRHAAAQVRPRHRQRRRRGPGGRQGEAPEQEHHGQRRLLGHPRRRRRELRRRAVVAGEARPRPGDRHGVQRPGVRQPGRRGRGHQVAAGGAIPAGRPLHQGARPAADGHLPVPVPRHLRRAPAGDEQPVPGAAVQPDLLQGDDVDPVRALHLPRQRLHGGGPPEPDHRRLRLQQRLQGDVRLRPAGHPAGRVGEHLQQARAAQRGADDPGPLRRRADRRRAGVGDAVPAPRRRAVQHPVHELLVHGGGRRRRADQVDQGLLRVHGAVRELQPEGGLLQLQGPGPWRERRCRQREQLPGRYGVGTQVLQGQLQEARHGQESDRPRRLLQERAEHPATCEQQLVFIIFSVHTW